MKQNNRTRGLKNINTQRRRAALDASSKIVRRFLLRYVTGLRPEPNYVVKKVVARATR